MQTDDVLALEQSSESLLGRRSERVSSPLPARQYSLHQGADTESGYFYQQEWYRGSELSSLTKGDGGFFCCPAPPATRHQDKEDVINDYWISLPLMDWLPFAQFGFGWLLPAAVCGALGLLLPRSSQ